MVEASLLAIRLIGIAGIDPKRVENKNEPARVARWLTLPGMTADWIVEIAAPRAESHRRRLAARERGVNPLGGLHYFEKAVYEAVGMEPPGAAFAAPPAQRSPEDLRGAAAGRSPAEIAMAAERRARRNRLGEKGRADFDAALDALDKGDQAALQRLIQRLHQERPYVIAAPVEERSEIGGLYQRMLQAPAAPARGHSESAASTKS